MTQDASEDPYRWLEDLEGERGARWVRDRNTHSTGALTGSDRFARLQAELRQVLDDEDRIPLPTFHGRHLYNLWKDAEHPRGLWRRTTAEEYRKREPDWEVLLDVDALAAAEGESWVWQEVEYLRPGGDRALVSLSPGGSDASEVREFDLVAGRFVVGGFALPAAKSWVTWIDRDAIFVATDFGPGSLTSSGYPRLVKRWRRGIPLAQAELVYAGEPEDMLVHAVHDPTADRPRELILRRLDFFRSEVHLRTGAGELVRLPVPEDAEISTHREWLLIRLRTAWTVGGHTYPEGALLGTGFDAFLAGGRDLAVLFAPDERACLSYYAWTRDRLILATLRDVRAELEVLTPGPAGWHRVPLAAPEGSARDPFPQVDVVDTDPDRGEEYALSSTGFLRPGTLAYGVLGSRAETVKEEPACFDAAGMSVRQFFTTSADGTRVPYFVVGRESATPGPTLLSGYGGFQIPRLPGYSGILGRGWLSGGGTYVVANIRGGGEYGPRWHRAAMRGNRLRAYEDFAAVAADLAVRGITTPAQLAAEGGSNGGLLTGVMLTRYPELFGAVVSQVPLLDMRRYHELLAGASWIAEYGDPDDESDWAYLREFSPYHNVHTGRRYPPVLFVTSTRDDRVHPGHARKMVARMLEYGHEVTYYENMEGGHGAAADNSQLAFKWALVLEFLWRVLGRH
ncbi:MAG TPA: prolyl oligopeptidase family serine peptidase [Rugosimonospora sp.]|nr:prolyl oligopeptidase family serine peptidase [Rugosimonospora sp.]